MNVRLLFPMIRPSPAALLPLLSAAMLSPAPANEALDVLEGRKDASDIALPPSATGSEPAALKRDVAYPDQQWPASPLESFWQRSVLYDNPDDPYVQHLAVMGLLEFRGAWGEVNGDTTNGSLDSTRTRRARLGARMRVFRNTELEAKAEIAGDSDTQGIERLSGKTAILPDASITYGKFRPRFTTEYATDDSLLPYPDRALLTNMLAPASTLGVALAYRADAWDFGIGWFSNDQDPWFPGLKGPGFLTFNVAKTVVTMSGSQPMRTRWHLDYIHNLDPGDSQSLPRYQVAGRRSANGGQLVTSNPAFRHLLSAGVGVETPTYGFDADFMLGRGDSSVWGMTLSPYYWAIPGRLKIVGRYHFADTDDAGALIATSGASADPYFDDSPFSIGDEYHSFYLGTNWHIDQNRLVLMGGLEHTSLKDDAGAGEDTDAWIWHAGARVAF